MCKVALLETRNHVQIPANYPRSPCSRNKGSPDSLFREVGVFKVRVRPSGQFERSNRAEVSSDYLNSR